MTIMKNKAVVTDITARNLEKYYNEPNGNLYFRMVEDSNSDYQVVDGFDLDELKAAIAYGHIEVIYVSGPAQEIIEKMLAEEAAVSEAVCA